MMVKTSYKYKICALCGKPIVPKELMIEYSKYDAEYLGDGIFSEYVSHATCVLSDLKKKVKKLEKEIKDKKNKKSRML